MSTPSARHAAPADEQAACCAHCTVKWITYFVQDTNGQTSGYWACSDCGKRFAPIQDEVTPLPPPQARTPHTTDDLAKEYEGVSPKGISYLPGRISAAGSRGADRARFAAKRHQDMDGD